MRSTRPPPVDLPVYRHRFMMKHADQGVLRSIDAADEHVEDDGSKEAQVGEKAEETTVSSGGGCGGGEDTLRVLLIQYTPTPLSRPL